MERLRGKIVEPFNRIENQTLMLTRLHETSDILRRVSRIQNLSRRLNSQMTTSNQGPDIVKAATSLHELGPINKSLKIVFKIGFIILQNIRLIFFIFACRIAHV